MFIVKTVNFEMLLDLNWMDLSFEWHYNDVLWLNRHLLCSFVVTWHNLTKKVRIKDRWGPLHGIANYVLSAMSCTTVIQPRIWYRPFAGLRSEWWMNKINIVTSLMFQFNIQTTNNSILSRFSDVLWIIHLNSSDIFFTIFSRKTKRICIQGRNSIEVIMLIWL